MKLDTKAIRYLTADDWRVLTAVEMGSKNHEVVPTPLITQISHLSTGSPHKSISTLAKASLVARVPNARYDGYRLTYGGLDYLALNAHRRSGAIYSLGNQIGVGKESDIFVCADERGSRRVLKVHRLGRISFRTVKANRDYLRGRAAGSWMYMSRLAALKEFAFMRALHGAGFPVPEPFAHNRHTLVMGLVDAFPLRQVAAVPDPAGLYAELMEMILRLAKVGLIHGDFNEFNILIEEERADFAGSGGEGCEDEAGGATGEAQESVVLRPVLIDFPQMLSTSHPNAEYYFDRDVACIKRFFSRRFGFTSDAQGPHFADATKAFDRRLDVEVEASGFSRKMAKELSKYMEQVGVDGDGAIEGGAEEEDECEESKDGTGEKVDTNSATVTEKDAPNQPDGSTRGPGGASQQRISAPLAVLSIQADDDNDASHFQSDDASYSFPQVDVSATAAARARASKAAGGWAI